MLLSSLDFNAATCTTALEYLRIVTVLDAVRWLASPSKEVNLNTTPKRFARCGFSRETNVCYGEIEGAVTIPECTTTFRNVLDW